jgi:predicted RNA-binding protein (TIGR00451 family)
LKESPDLRTLSIMIDYLFGRGVSRALPKSGLRLVRSRRSGRVKLVYHGQGLFATVRPNGTFALTLSGAGTLLKSTKFRDSCVVVTRDAEGFVSAGKSVFCKFVASAGKNVLPRGEVAVVSRRGSLLGVGTAVMNGAFMSQFKTGVAVKVRDGVKR